MQPPLQRVAAVAERTKPPLQRVAAVAERTRPTSLGPNSRAEWQRNAKFDLYAAKAKR